MHINISIVLKKKITVPGLKTTSLESSGAAVLVVRVVCLTVSK
jgi:hypothetical protein